MKGYLRTLQPPTAVQTACLAKLEGKQSIVVISGPHMKCYVRSGSVLELAKDMKLHGNVMFVSGYETIEGHDDLLLVVGEPGTVGLIAVTEGGNSTVAQMELLQAHRVRVPKPCFDFDQQAGMLAVHIHMERIQMVTVSKQSVSPDLLRLVEHHLVDHQVHSLNVLSSTQVAFISSIRGKGFVSVYDFEAEALQTLSSLRNTEGAAIRKLPAGLWLCFSADIVLVFTMNNLHIDTIQTHFGPIECVGSGEQEAILAVSKAKDLVVLTATPNLPYRTLLSGISATSLIRIDSEYVFLSSTEGNSSLLRVPIDHSEAVVTWELQSLAPVTSLHLHFTQSDSRVVTASRTSLGSAISTCKWGTRLNSDAEMQIGRAVNIWTIPACEYDTLIVLAFSGQTRTAVLTNSTLAEVNIPGFEYSESTVFVAKCAEALISVGKRCIRVIQISSGNCTSTVPISSEIVLCSASSSRLYTITVDQQLTVWLIQGLSIQEINHVTLPFEPSAVASTPTYVAMACFQGRFLYFCDPVSLESLRNEEISLNFSPRCLLFEDFGGSEVYLFCGLGDGYLLTYTVSHTGISKKSLQYIGNYVTNLVPFQCNSERCVLIISDRPMVLHIRNKKLKQTYLSCPEMRLASGLEHPEHESGLAVVAEDQLQLLSLSGIFDFELNIDRKSVENVSLMETFRRKVYLISTISGIFYAKAYDLDTNESWERRLSSNNEPVCILPCDSGLLVCTQHGTSGQVSLLHPFADDPRVPRFIQLPQIPVAASRYNSDTVIIAFQQTLTLWTISAAGEMKLQAKKTQYTGTVVGCMDVEYGLIVVGDMVRDVAVFIFTPEGFERLGPAIPLGGVVSVKLHSPVEVLVCDQMRNLFLLTLVETAMGSKELQLSGGIHLGDMLTCMQVFPSSLTTQTVLSSVQGGLYLYKSLSPEEWRLLVALTPYLSASGIAFFRHQEFTSPATRFLLVPSDTILDGDLLLSFLDCTKSQQLEILHQLELADIHTNLEELQLLITQLAYNY